jgi:hypothetical protein
MRPQLEPFLLGRANSLSKTTLTRHFESSLTCTRCDHSALGTRRRPPLAALISRSRATRVKASIERCSTSRYPGSDPKALCR